MKRFIYDPEIWNTLNDREKEILFCCALDGLSQRAVAKDLGVSPARVWQILHEALAKLRAYKDKAARL